MRPALVALVLLLLTACGSANGDQDCDPGGRFEAALLADVALQQPPAGVREVERVLVESDSDSKTGDCNDPILFLDLEPVTALTAYADHVERAGWTVVATRSDVFEAERLLGGVPAELRVNVLRDDGVLRVMASIPLPDG